MVRQDGDGVDLEGPLCANDAKSMAQGSDLLDQKRRTSIFQDDREKVCPAGNKIPPVADHWIAAP
jgi:hypothetical protein